MTISHRMIETNGISMSQFVEHRVGDFLGRSTRLPADDRPFGSMTVPSAPVASASPSQPVSPPRTAAPQPQPQPAVLAPAAAPPVRTTITPRPAPPAPPPAKLKPEQIFTF